MIATDRHLRDQQPRDRTPRHAHSHEITRQQGAIGILENAASLQGTSRLVDVRVGVVDQTIVRVPALGLQADLDRNLELGDIPAPRTEGRAYLLHVPLANIEPHPDRLELDYAGELTRLIAADKLPERYQSRSDHPVKGSRDGRVAQIDLPGLAVGLSLKHIRT